MYDILLVSEDQSRFKHLVSGFQELPSITLRRADTVDDALALCAEKTYDLLVADEQIQDRSGLGLVRNVVAVNPMINCALVSSLDADTFHEVTEGLGLLAALGAAPGPEQAQLLLEKLDRIAGVQSGQGKTL